MSVILVGGSAGFIGSNFCHWLINNTEHYVVGVDNLSGGYYSNMPESERFEFVNMDMCSDQLQLVYANYEPDVTYALNCYAAEGRSNHIGRFIHSNNTLALTNTLNNCVNFNSKIIFTSSVAVYSGNPPYHEDYPPHPIDFYGSSKLASEREIEIAGKYYGIEWCILRPRNVYGVRQSMWDKARNVIAIWCYQALNNKPITVFGDGSNRRCFTYIDDILSPMYEALRYDKQIINIGASKPYSIKQAAEMFMEVSGHDKIKYLEPREETPQAICYTDKAEALLNYRDETTLYDGLKKMWEWAKIQPVRNIDEPPPLEITKNTHSSLL